MAEILYQDDAILVINKPAGIPVLPDGWNPDAPYLLKQLEQEFGKLWVVHRLDKVTSGGMVFARSAETHRTLSRLFETCAVHKTYHAIVIGNPRWDEHTARHPLRMNVGHSHRTVVDNRKGKPSETAFRVLERFSGYSLLEAVPTSGRTHQVRVHAYALGFPLLGDMLYCLPAVGQSTTPLHIDRPALHAYSIEFEFGGKPYLFTIPHPSDFENALATLRHQH